MRLVPRILLTAAAVTLAAFGLAPTASAAGPTFTVWDGGSREYHQTCAKTAPFACGTSAHAMYVQVTSSSTKPYAVTIGFQVEAITATAGSDYTTTSGTATIPAHQNNTGIHVQLVNDGVGESSETFRVRITSSSVGGTFTDTGIGTITDGGLIPPDCTLSKSSLVHTAMTCVNRPAGSRWRQDTRCADTGGWGYLTEQGTVVVGNGTSTTDCSDWPDYNGTSFVPLP